MKQFALACSWGDCIHKRQKLNLAVCMRACGPAQNQESAGSGSRAHRLDWGCVIPEKSLAGLSPGTQI